MRTKTYTLTGVDADTDAFALAQAPATGADADGLALSQAFDVAADTNNIAAAQSYADGVALTLEALAASLIPPRKLTLTSATDESGTNFTVVGVNELGAADGEVLVGPNNATVTSVKTYSAITSITPDATEAVDTIEAGYPANTTPFQLTLNGVLGNGLNAVSDVFSAAKVTLTSSDNLSARTFTIIGLGTNGLAQSEVLAGPNNTTVSSVYNYTRVDSITPDDDAAGSLSAGIGSLGTGLTLTAGAVSISPAKIVTLTSAANLSGINFTIVGTDRWGNASTETIAGPNNNTVRYVSAYASITSITPSASSGSNVEAGFPIGATTPWIQIGRSMGQDAVPSALVSVLAATGSPDALLNITYSEFPRFPEAEISKDQIVSAGSFTPGTPVSVQGQGVQVELTTGAGTTAVVRVTRPLGV